MIDLQNVHFRWSPAEPPLISIPALTVADGECIFIEGPSGSGKTTLLNLLGGIVSPEIGQIEINGTNICTLTNSGRDAFRADHIGFIFQMFNLVPYLTIIDNVTLPCRFSKTRQSRSISRSGTPTLEAKRLLRQMDLDPDEFGERPITQLSVGQQQRVAAARALIGSPELIIADEPTSALDASSRTHFLALLFTEVKSTGATLMFVSHDTALAPSFDRALSLSNLNELSSCHC